MPDNDNPTDRSVVRADPIAAPSVVPLGPAPSLDLSGLPDDQRLALIADYAKGRIDIAHRAEELGVEIRALDETLKTLTDTTKDVSASGDAVTITHTQTTSVGRTEIIMGNTTQAQSGKLSRSQTGDTDWTPFLIGGGLIGAVLVALAFAGR